ncbi:MAG TPA: hypothetical protein VFV31_13020 [Chitinophagaceae bacterium]|nr:hypothetical protein [Chitinophagaceae bacterium]
MRLEHTILSAKDLQPDSLIYLKDEKRFFWIDDIDHICNEVVLYFEEGIGRNGLMDYKKIVPRYKKMILITEFNK